MAKNKKAQILAAVVCASTVLALHPVDTAKAAPTSAPVSAPTVTLDGNSYGVSTQGILDGILDDIGNLTGDITAGTIQPILTGLTNTVNALDVKVDALDGLLGIQIGDDGQPILINNSYVIGSGDKNFEHLVVGEKGKFVANKDGSFGTLRESYNPKTMTGDYLDKEGNYVFHVDSDTGYIYASGGNFKTDANGNIYASGGKFKTDADGSIYASDGNFKTDADGSIYANGGSFKTDAKGNVTAGTYNGIIISRVDKDSAIDNAGDIKLDDINVSKMQNRVNELKTYTAGEGIDIQDTDSKDGDQTISVKTGDGLKIDTANNNKVAVKLKDGEKNLNVDGNGLSLNKALKVDTVNGVNIKTEEGDYVFGNVNVSDVKKDVDSVKDKTQYITAADENGTHGTHFDGNITASGDVTTGNGNSLDTVANKVANATTYKEGNGVEFTGEGQEKAINVKLKDGEENLKVDESGLSLNKELKVDTVNGVNINKTEEGDYVFGDVNVSVVQKDVNIVKDKTQYITADENGTHFNGNITASGDVTTGKGNSLDKVADKVQNIQVDEDGNIIVDKIAGWEYDEKTYTATIAGSININKYGTISATTDAKSYLDLKQGYTELGYGDNKIHLDENGIGLKAGDDDKVETTVGNTTVTTTQDGTEFNNGESSTVINGGNITTDNITTDNITTSTITAGNGNFTVDKDGNVTSGSINGVQIGTNEKGDIIINGGTDNKGEVIINGSNISSSTENVAGIDRVEDGENSTTVIENNTTIDNQGNLNTVNGNFKDQITVGGENGTLITNKDVTINKGTENEISLSQMGKVDNIDKELQSNSNYDGTVVGGLNAEANIRREQVSVLNNRVNSLENRIGNVEERIDKVGAMAAAIANLRTMGYDPEAPTEIAVGIGQYKSETGLALGVFHYPNEDFMLSASLSTSGDEVMGGIGATWKLGRKTEAEKAQDIETKRLKKAEEMKLAAQKSKVEAQKERHAKMLEERQNHKTA